MFKTLSLKTKMIIFAVLALIGTFIIFRAGMENRRVEEAPRNQYETELREKR
jgi:hypothetical protein